jgi:hypothetical protein
MILKLKQSEAEKKQLIERLKQSEEVTKQLEEEKKQREGEKKQSEAEKKQLIERLKQSEGEKKQLVGKNKQLEAQFPTLREIASKPIHIRNETDSSAHTKTGHRKATHTIMNMPPVNLPDSFWNYRPQYKFPTSINGEADVNSNLSILIREIANGLGLEEYFHSMLDVPVMDTAPDVALITVDNKRMFGVVEGKKAPRTEREKTKIFGSDTEVAGEAFEQLFLLHLANETFAVGLVATLQSFQLTCTQDISGWSERTPDAATEYFKAQKEGGPPVTTPDKQKVLDDCSKPAAANRSKKHKQAKQVNMTSRPPKSKNGPKNGRVQVEIKKEHVKMEYFATEPISFSSNATDNEKVFELLAGFVLLCVESLKQAPKNPLDLSEPGVRSLARLVKIGNEPFSFKQIELPSGLRYDSNPLKEHSVFYALRQLGYGQSGTCCFCCTDATAAPCVIKFFRQNHEFEDAKKEAKMWQKVYGDLGFDFVRAEENPRVLLIMPYLRVPRNLAERQKLVEGEEDSLLYKALQRIAGKGYIHREVFWHHVGLMKVVQQQRESHQSSKSKRFGMKLPFMGGRAKRNIDDAAVSATEIAIFCDLIHAEPCDDKSKREDWVKTSFEDMKKRMGSQSN